MIANFGLFASRKNHTEHNSLVYNSIQYKDEIDSTKDRLQINRRRDNGYAVNKLPLEQVRPCSAAAAGAAFADFDASSTMRN